MDYNPDEVAAQEHQTWQGAAGLYVDYIAPMTATSGQIPLLQEIGQIQGGEAVLEVGCGTGDVAIQLADLGCNVVGIDFAENMIDVAQVRFPQIKFEVSDAETTPFSEGQFDVVVSNYTAHHFAQPQRVFEEARRVLKTGGRLALVMPIQAEQRSFGSFLSSATEEIPPEEVPGGPLLNAHDPKELVRLLEAAGFRNVLGEKRLKPIALENIDTLLTAGWAIMGLDEHPQDVQNRIRARTIERAAPFKQPDGSYNFPDMVLVACGVK